MFDRLTKQLVDQESITELLRAQDQMAWVVSMNSVRNRVEKTVISESSLSMK